MSSHYGGAIALLSHVPPRAWGPAPQEHITIGAAPRPSRRMGTALMSRPAHVGMLAHLVTQPHRVTVVRAGTGLGAPEMIAFKERLMTMLRHVAELWPRADIVTMRSAVLTEALRNPELCKGSDNDLTALLLYAAETRLRIGSELTPIVDRDPDTGDVTVAAVEKVAGLVRLMTDAGARAVSSGTVYQADVFRHNFENGEREFTFTPNIATRDRGVVTGYFAVVDRPRGEWSAKVLTVAEVEALRKASTTPNHRAWRDYRDRMGELQCLRAIAEWIPKGFARPRLDFGAVDEPASAPLGSLSDDDPYAPAPRAAASVVTADYEITEEPVFSSAAHAGEEALPGDRNVFWGWGGEKVSRCPDKILRRVRSWISESLDRQVRYARLDLACQTVLAARATQDTDAQRASQTHGAAR